MTTYQVGDVAETNDGRLAFVAHKDSDGQLRAIVENDGFVWVNCYGENASEGDPMRPAQFLARLVWRSPEYTKREAQAKREQAAKLLAEAEQLEQSA